jgi:hypothetical protein
MNRQNKTAAPAGLEWLAKLLNERFRFLKNRGFSREDAKRLVRRELRVELVKNDLDAHLHVLDGGKRDTDR